MTQKNILIVTASIGSGHNKAAAAISNELKNRYPNAHINVVDFMSPDTAYLNDLLKEIYLKMLDFVPGLYKFLYSFTAGPVKGSSVQTLLAHFMKHNMASIVKKHQADIIVCTHPFPCAAAAYLKSKNELEAKLFTVVTDFCLHQIWIYKNVDMYFVAHEQLAQELYAKGLDKNHVTVTGIPINRNFTQEYDKKMLIKKFDLQENMPVILIMGGGLGLGGVQTALEALETLTIPMQILVVTGANVALWSEVNAYVTHSRHSIKVWGYSHNINELMAIASLLISKPGALTTSEAMAMELPMVLQTPIPGPEAENADYLVNNGVAVLIQKQEQISDIVKNVIGDEDRLAWMKEKARELKRPDAAKKIVDVIAYYME